MSIKLLIAALFVSVFGYELYRRHDPGPGRWVVAVAAILSAYELFHRKNFGTIEFLIVIGFAIYAWRNWFVSLCAVLVLMAFLENPDTPHGFAGIQGLNPWNVLMLNVLGGWWVDRRRRGDPLDIPPKVVFWAMCYLFVIVWSYIRIANDYQALNILNQSDETNWRRVNYTFLWVMSEYLINCVKWVLPGILFFDACRTRQRTVVALGFVFVLYFLVAIQVIQCMPLRAAVANSGELARIAARDLDRSVGYFRTELSMMLAGASWAILSTVAMVSLRRHQLVVLGSAAIVALAQAMTGGRAGYVTWGLTGLILCILRWRWLLPSIPLAIILVCLFLPSVRDRMLMGFVESDRRTSIQVDDFTITSGRTLAWSYVIPKIEESPIFGYGREAMIRVGIYQKILAENEGEVFPHPHNAYLELLLDNGIVGFLLVIPFYILVLSRSFGLLMDRSDPIFSAAGGVACSLVLGLLFASMGSQSFYPKESSVGMWVAIGIMFRVYVERARWRETGEPMFGEEENKEPFETGVEIETPA